METVSSGEMVFSKFPHTIHTIVLKHYLIKTWVIPIGRGTICDGVNYYIRKCTIYYP